MKFEIDSLVLEVLDRLPETVWSSNSTTFFDPAIGGGQFVRVIEQRLREHGHSDSNIQKRVFGFEESNLHIRYAVNKHKLVGQYARKPYNKFFEMDDSMKFDVIIGNPPYQDADDSGGALWEQFANKAFNSSVKAGGIVAMIHPPSFIGKHQNTGKGKSDYSCFNENQIDEVHIFDDHKKNVFFSGVGTRICWYIARKQLPSVDTKIVGYDQGIVTEHFDFFPNVTFLPLVVNNVTMSIHKKLMSVPSISFIQKRELHYHTMKSKETVSDTADSKFCYKSYFSHKIVRYSNYRFSDYSAIKVMVPQTSTIENCFIDNDCNVSEDLFYVVCNTIKEANDLKKYLTSPLVKYIGRLYRPGRNLGSLLGANIIPNINSSINWTVEELDYINNAIK
jgi:hypothetical protein